MALKSFSFDLPKKFEESLEEKKAYLASGTSPAAEKIAALEKENEFLKKTMQDQDQQLQQALVACGNLQREVQEKTQQLQEAYKAYKALKAEYDELCDVLEAYVEKENSNDANASSGAEDDDDSDALPGLEIARPSVRLADVAGLEEIKDQIRLRLIEPLQNPDRAKKYGISSGGGICLYGPPGSGKTFIAQAVAGELGLPFLAISAADLKSPYYSGSTKNIKTLFEKNLAKYDTSILFIDEMESLFRSRSENQPHEASQDIVNTFLQYMDGMKNQKKTILFLGATNAPYMIDEAVLRPGRFDEKIYVGLPDYQARLQILRNCAGKSEIPWERGVMESVAEQMDRFSGADIKGWVTKLMQIAYDKRLDRIDRQTAQECLRDARPSINSDIMRRIQEWEAAHNLPVHR